MHPTGLGPQASAPPLSSWTPQVPTVLAQQQVQLDQQLRFFTSGAVTKLARCLVFDWNTPSKADPGGSGQHRQLGC